MAKYIVEFEVLVKPEGDNLLSWRLRKLIRLNIEAGTLQQAGERAQQAFDKAVEAGRQSHVH